MQTIDLFLLQRSTLICFKTNKVMRPNIGVDNEALLHIFLCSSFDSNSDDNLLKNIELFDRLSLSFNSRVLFIKDVIGDEICCWSFYGQGRKLAEVCCTSIVYATEKKQTKVRSVEAIFQPRECLPETFGGTRS